MNINDTLIEIKNKLSVITSVKTLHIGLERGIGSRDTPFIRIVPTLNTLSDQDYCINTGGDDLSVDIVFGFDRKNKDIELLYSDYYALEEEIRDVLLTPYTNGRCLFEYTVTDEDELENIKSAISKFRVVGIAW